MANYNGIKLTTTAIRRQDPTSNPAGVLPYSEFSVSSSMLTESLGNQTTHTNPIMPTVTQPPEFIQYWST